MVKIIAVTNDGCITETMDGFSVNIGVIAIDIHGEIYHTYSSYARGLENFLTTYSLLDIVHKGRNEKGHTILWNGYDTRMDIVMKPSLIHFVEKIKFDYF